MRSPTFAHRLTIVSRRQTLVLKNCWGANEASQAVGEGKNRYRPGRNFCLNIGPIQFRCLTILTFSFPFARKWPFLYFWDGARGLMLIWDALWRITTAISKINPQATRRWFRSKMQCAVFINYFSFTTICRVSSTNASRTHQTLRILQDNEDKPEAKPSTPLASSLPL